MLLSLAEGYIESKKVDMKAKEFVVEYNQAKTAQVFGNKLLTALALDRSTYLPGALATSRAYLKQKEKIETTLTDSSKQQIISDVLSALEGADPTPNKQYTRWLANVYANEKRHLEDILSKCTDWLKTYQLLKLHRILPPNLTDINRLSFDQLYDVKEQYIDVLLDKMDAVEQATMSKGNAHEVLNNDQVRVIVPEDMDAAIYYGQGTKWCTAAKNNNMFDRYNADGSMYILLPKSPRHDGEKYQLHFGVGQFMDESDQSVDCQVLLSSRFGNLIPLFKQVEPQISQLVAFADDNVLEPILAKIKEYAMDFINDCLSELEQGDDYYYTWLKDNGYVDEEGDPDFYADGASYLEYNTEADEDYRSMIASVSISPSDLRENTHEFVNANEFMPTIDQLDQVVSYICHDRDNHRLARWVDDNIVVSEAGKVSRRKQR